MHETYQTTVQTLTPWLINWAKTNNLKLVTVGKLAFHNPWIGMELTVTAECLGDPTGMYQAGNFTGNGQSKC